MKTLLIVTTLLFSLSSFAQTRYSTRNGNLSRLPAAAGFMNEFSTNLTGAFFSAEKRCKDCSSGTNLTLSGSFLRTWQDNMQYGGEGGVRILSKETSGTGSSETLLDVMAIGAYNLDSDFSNSIYAKAGIGFNSVPKSNGNGYETGLGLFIGAGKRFAWLNNVTYSPEIRLVKKSDIDLGVQIHVLNFSIVW